MTDYLKEFLPKGLDSSFFIDFEKQNSIVHLKKNEALTQIGSTNNEVYFIIEGSIARKVITNAGMEVNVTLQSKNFLPFITCIDSFFNQEKSDYFLQATKKSIVLKINYKFIKESLNNYPLFLKFYNSYIEEFLFFTELIRAKQLSLNKQDLIKWLINHYPILIQEFPSKDIASYIGVSSEWYSKLRRKIFS